MKHKIFVSGVNPYTNESIITEVEAYQYGTLAVHKIVDTRRVGWVITHVPTGYSVWKGFKTKKIAFTIAQEIEEFSPREGTLGETLPMEIRKPLGDALFAALKAHNLTYHDYNKD